MSLEIGAIVEGEVTGITNFGAFVQLPENKVGLIHISEVSNVYVKDVHDFLKVHDKVKVKVLAVDDRGKIGLSIKALMAPSEAPAQNRAEQGQKPDFKARPQRPQGETRDRRPAGGKSFGQGGRAAGPLTFEDKLSKFLKDSDDRMLDLKRNTESKRGGRGARRER